MLEADKSLKEDIRDLLNTPLNQKYMPSYTFPRLIQVTQKYLAKYFGVSDMTILEQRDLRECCDKAGHLYFRQLVLRDQDTKYSFHTVWPVKEAAWYWLIETLGVDSNFIAKNRINSNAANEYFKQWIKIERDRRNQVELWG